MKALFKALVRKFYTILAQKLNETYFKWPTQIEFENLTLCIGKPMIGAFYGV